MPVIYENIAKVERMLGTRTAIDSGGAAGRIEICTAAYGAVLATITLGYSGNSTGTVNGTGLLTFAGFPRSDASADASGTAAVARIRNSAGATVASGMTCGTSSGDLILNNLNFTAGLPITINAASLQHA